MQNLHLTFEANVTNLVKAKNCVCTQLTQKSSRAWRTLTDLLPACSLLLRACVFIWIYMWCSMQCAKHRTNIIIIIIKSFVRNVNVVWSVCWCRIENVQIFAPTIIVTMNFEKHQNLQFRWDTTRMNTFQIHNIITYSFHFVCMFWDLFEWCICVPAKMHRPGAKKFIAMCQWRSTPMNETDNRCAFAIFFLLLTY